MIDYQKLQMTFVEEAMERLSELEDGLLQLEKSPGDKELINGVFRAVHTIKGCSGSVGLSEICEFTHHIEGLLDLVRQERLRPDKNLIGAVLAGGDLIREMVSAIGTDKTVASDRRTGVLEIIEDIRKKGCARLYKIIFIPDRSLFKEGHDPSSIISQLREIGEILSIQADTEPVPPLSEIHYDEIYLRWDILLRTEKPAEEIRNVFDFVRKGSEIRIFPVTSLEKEPLLGHMLVEEGAARAEDVAAALGHQRRLGDILLARDKVAADDIEHVIEKQRLKKIESFNKSVSSTIRVDLKKLDALLNLIGEMVISHSILHRIICEDGGNSDMPEDLEKVFSQLTRIGKDIQESAMSLRMLPVREIFQRFVRLVRELSGSKNTQVELVMSGEETELDKGVIEKITDPLVHLIRNAIDHGIEPAQERLQKGKPAHGTIHLIAYQVGNSVCIEVEDDGRGLDRERILRKAVESGLTKAGARLTDEEVYSFIFLPGFSTTERVTDISGRGVGLDVVKKNIGSLDGKVTVLSRPGGGTTFSIKLPLTLAIIDGLVARVGKEVYVIPLTSVVESLRPAKDDLGSLNEKGEVVRVRDEYIPLIRLYEGLCAPEGMKDPSQATVVVTANDNKRCCLLVDELIGQQQIVIKNLGASIPNVRGIAGGTILGDGKVALILDVAGLIETTLVSA